MKNLFTILIAILFLPLVSLARNDKSGQVLDEYGDVIYIENVKDEVLDKSVADLQYYLSQLSSKKFRVEYYKPESPFGKGIYLVMSKGNVVSADIAEKLSKKSIEDFYISTADNKLVIVANHPLGLSRGIYTFLDTLGVKWYFPGEQWTYVPKQRSITINLHRFYSPSFTLRDFFGTGGLFPVYAFSETETIKKEWDDWKRRNRMGGSVRLGGHYWETFNTNHREELIKHPEYVALIGGKRVPWSASAKFCISNPSLQKLFVEDRMNWLKMHLKQSSNLYEKIMIPVDPSDGGGHCECDECKRMGSISDRVFYLANLVARSAAKISSRAWVNLYAYNQHAKPPSIKIEDNVMVQIIPYAFQNVGTPGQMIEMWRKKSGKIFLYDYYGIPDWHFETPLTGRWSVKELEKKIKYWNNIGIKGFLLESSNGIGTTGVGLYLMSRLGWDISENTDKIIGSFYKNMFGAGGMYVKTYFNKINNNFREIADIPFLYDQLEQAAKKENDQVANSRVNALKSYVHYTLLYYQYKNSKDPVKDGSWERLMKYSWEIYPSKMIHTTRVAQLLLQRPNLDKQLVSKWNLYDTKAPGIKNIKWATEKDVNNLVSYDKRNYALLPDFDYLPSAKYEFITAKNVTGKSEMTFLNFPDMVIRMSVSGEFHFLLRSNPTSAKNESQPVTVMLIDKNSGDVVSELKKDLTHEWSDVSLNGDAGKTYGLYLKNANWINFSADNRNFYYLENVPTYSYPGKLWFYVPEGKVFIYFRNTAQTNPVFYNGSGKAVQTEKINSEGVYKLPVSGSTGWWSMEKAELKFLDFYLETGFFPHPKYLVKEVGAK
jgi:hypothetical protein